MIDNPLNRLSAKRGSSLYNAKLDETDVYLIRRLVEEREKHREIASRLTNRKLADKFGVHHSTIDKITSGEAWGHVQ